jgi:hypothetical protein
MIRNSLSKTFLLGASITLAPVNVQASSGPSSPIKGGLNLGGSPRGTTHTGTAFIQGLPQGASTSTSPNTSPLYRTPPLSPALSPLSLDSSPQLSQPSTSQSDTAVAEAKAATRLQAQWRGREARQQLKTLKNDDFQLKQLTATLESIEKKPELKNVDLQSFKDKVEGLGKNLPAKQSARAQEILSHLKARQEENAQQAAQATPGSKWNPLNWFVGSSSQQSPASKPTAPASVPASTSSQPATQPPANAPTVTEQPANQVVQQPAPSTSSSSGSSSATQATTSTSTATAEQPNILKRGLNALGSGASSTANATKATVETITNTAKAMYELSKVVASPSEKVSQMKQDAAKTVDELSNKFKLQMLTTEQQKTIPEEQLNTMTAGDANQLLIKSSVETLGEEFARMLYTPEELAQMTPEERKNITIKTGFLNLGKGVRQVMEQDVAKPFTTAVQQGMDKIDLTANNLVEKSNKIAETMTKAAGESAEEAGKKLKKGILNLDIAREFLKNNAQTIGGVAGAGLGLTTSIITTQGTKMLLGGIMDKTFRKRWQRYLDRHKALLGGRIRQQKRQYIEQQTMRIQPKFYR